MAPICVSSWDTYFSLYSSDGSCALCGGSFTKPLLHACKSSGCLYSSQACSRVFGLLSYSLRFMPNFADYLLIQSMLMLDRLKCQNSRVRRSHKTFFSIPTESTNVSFTKKKQSSAGKHNRLAKSNFHFKRIVKLLK